MNDATDAEIQVFVAHTLLALADLLAGLPASVWDESSLCDGWRVREVVAHCTMPARYTPEQFMEMLAGVGYDFPSLSNRLASDDPRLPTSDLLGNLRDEVLHQWTPPGGGWRGALNHAAIHSLDVTAAIGESRCSGDDAMRTVLDHLTAGGIHREFGVDLPAVTLRDRPPLVVR